MATRLVFVLGLLGCVSAGSWMSEFMTGINLGREEELDCATDPAKCLESVGRGLGLMTSGEWTKAVSQVTMLPGVSTPISEYFAGFLKGLQSNPESSNMCTSLINNWIDVIGSISTMEIKNFTFLELIEASCSVFYQFNNEILSACNLNQLINALRFLNLYDYLLAYLANNCQLNAAIIGVEDCKANYYTCGYSSGVIIRLETGWSVDPQV